MTTFFLVYSPPQFFVAFVCPTTSRPTKHSLLPASVVATALAFRPRCHCGIKQQTLAHKLVARPSAVRKQRHKIGERKNSRPDGELFCGPCLPQRVIRMDS